MTHRFWTIIVAGALATIAFDLFGQALSPLAGQAKLAPVGLAGSTLKSVIGSNPKGLAYLLHGLTGLIAYPLGWLLIAQPLHQRFAPAIPTALVATAYGIGLWIFALYGMAHLVAGMKPFLGWGNITWVALAGHVVYAWVAVWALNAKPGSQPLTIPQAA